MAFGSPFLARFSSLRRWFISSSSVWEAARLSMPALSPSKARDGLSINDGHYIPKIRRLPGKLAQVLNFLHFFSIIDHNERARQLQALGFLQPIAGRFESTALFTGLWSEKSPLIIRIILTSANKGDQHGTVQT